jgi:hypothetical protein
MSGDSVQLRAVLSSCALAGALLAAAPVTATPFEAFISIDSEEDLYDLHATGQIDDEALTTLVELYQRGVDLNRADRQELYSLPNLTYAEVDAILEYRELAGWILDPIDLVVAGILTQEKLEAVAAFLVLTDRRQALFATDGWVRAQTRWSAEDSGAPPMALQARVATFQNLTVGFAATLSHTRLGDVRYDPIRGALSAEAPTSSAYLPKAYARWETDTWGAIVGTYRIGFGQRLTFDNTSLYTPNGFYLDDELSRTTSLTRECKESAGELDTSPCAGEAGRIYVTPDYRWREGLLGAALGLKKLELGKGNLQAYGFVSYQPRSIYQYQIYSPDTCDDPRDDTPACSAPQVFRRQDDPFERTSRFSFQTLPNMYADLTGGGNISYSMGRRGRIGFTGYGSSVNWLVEGMELDFQEWARYPFGGPFGAVGVDGSYGFDKYDFFAELTRSFDSMPDGGGGLAGILRWVTTFEKNNELETSLRYYDRDFKNPYARPISAPDQLEGARARDEVGMRLRYTARLKKRLNLRSNADLWASPSDRSTNTILYVRSDVAMTDQYGWGLWGQYQNKDVSRNGVGECFSVSTDQDEDGEPIPCAGEKYQLTGRLRYTPTPRYTLTAQYQHELQSEARYDTRYRQDASASLIGTARLSEELRLRGRSRYLFEDISDNGYLEQSLWTYLDATYRVRARDRLRVRYDLYVYLDDRASTATRVPSPEHWLWLEYESRF